MRILLDTHVWIWWVTGQADLSTSERAALDGSAEKDPPFISAISLWEAQMLHARRRLQLEMPFEPWLIEASGAGVVQVLPLDVSVILAVDRLPRTFHGDPADRIIVASARAHNLALATHDRRIRRSRLARPWKP